MRVQSTITFEKNPGALHALPRLGFSNASCTLQPAVRRHKTIRE
jgi:hypothetical protein